MTIRPHLIALTLAVGVTAVAGCGSSTDAGSSPTSTASATSSTSTTPSTSTSSTPAPSTNSTAAGAPGVPEPARQHTKAGAIAFANYYIDTVNSVGLRPRNGALEPLSLKGCKTCDNFIETVSGDVKNHTRLDGDQLIAGRAFSPYVRPESPKVWVVTKSPEVHLLDDSGTRVKTYAKYPTMASVFLLTWTANGWKASEIKYDKSVTK